ncbi:hypothetical protein QAD02_014726, partial [Eretmocerus hayati]
LPAGESSSIGATDLPAAMITTTLPTTTTTTNAASNPHNSEQNDAPAGEVIQHLPELTLDDITTTLLTTTNTSSSPSATTTPGTRSVLNFVNVPKSIETELGASLQLACRTAEPVVECRWSWRPLLPTNLPLPSIDNGPEDDRALVKDENSIPSITTSTTASPSLELPVRSFSAFGNASNDCSVRFYNVNHEQTGYWSCAARRAGEENFTSTEPAKLSITQIDTGGPITFVEQESSRETPAGTGLRLPCRTASSVVDCQWSWRQLNQSQPWDAEMRRFSAAGNDSTDCELGLPAVRAEHEGLWTCGARARPNAPFVHAPPIKLLISEVEFVQLSRGIQITAGEAVFLRCLVNKPVYQCEWSWRPSNSSKNSTLLRTFAPARENDHDCSVRFKNILYDEEGIWTCGVRLTPEGILHEAPSTTVTLLPSGKVNFTEAPESTSAPFGSEFTLHCSTNARAEKCAWAWRPLNSPSDTEPSVLHEFPSQGELGRNCSLSLAELGDEHEGYWTCRVYLAGQPSQNNVMSPPEAKLIVYHEEDVRFSELSQDIQISSGGSVSLRCVTGARVEQCRWSLTPEGSANTTVVVKQFAPVGPEGRDCSVKLSHALREQEGLWTCGARLQPKHNYTDAPPARLSLIEPAPITVTVWGMPHQLANLACKTTSTSTETECIWTHGSELQFWQTSSETRRMKHTVMMNHTTGVCSIQFIPDDSDFGEWGCEFFINNTRLTSELGSASILLLNNSPDEQLGWLVGALTSAVLFALIVIVVVVVCRNREGRIPSFLETKAASASGSGAGINGMHATGSSPRGHSGSEATRMTTKFDLCSYHSNPSFLCGPDVDNINSVLPNRSPQPIERGLPRPHQRHGPPVLVITES